MRARVFLTLSVLINAALAAVILSWWSATPIETPPRSFSNQLAAPSNVYRIVKTNVLVRPRVFTWHDVESGDYATYIQNLRDLGMPEATIRDIIVADVDQLFGKRRRDAAAAQDMEWWRLTASAEAQSNALARMHAIESERRALLTKLLGEGWDKDRAEPEPAPVALSGPVLSALPEDVKQRVQDIAARSAERLRDYYAELESSGQAASALELAQMREETRQQLAQALNPQQLEEFLLRYSENANRLRRQFASFELAPEEFRRLFRAVDQIDRDIQLRFSADDPISLQQRAALEQRRAAAAQEALGQERYAKYQLQNDPAYQDALAAVRKAGVSQEYVGALYEITRATADESTRIRNDPSLTPEEKETQIRDAEYQRLRARALVLGEPVPEPAPPPPPQTRVHTMEPFETLGQLSLRYGIRMSEIRAANPGVDINRLPPGAVINLPPGGIPVLPPLPPGLVR